MSEFLKGLLIILTLLGVVSCHSNEVSTEKTGKGILNFQENNYSFGELTEGEVVGHRFKAINTGTGPVSISNVKKSCGCTDAIYPKQPIMPGDSAYVEVIFDTKGWSGRQVKRVMVYSNDSTGVKELRVWADVNR